MNSNFPTVPSADYKLVLRGPASARLTLDGREYINFAGCGYLALGRQQELRDAALKALEEGAAFSSQLPPIYGIIDEAVRQLEDCAAEYCGTEDSVYAASGYFIGAAALATIDTKNSVLFIDEGSHFSLFDAAHLTTRPVVSFRHADPEALTHAIGAALLPTMRPIVVSDGVFATTGRVAPLDKYAGILANYNGHLVIDEAHSFGVLGMHGRGAADYHRVESIATSAGTLSKAFCAQGAIIGCSVEAADRLRRVPPLRGANPGSPISAAVGAASIRYVQEHPELRTRLTELTSYLRNRLKRIGFDVGESPAPILAFRNGDLAFMQTIQKRLFAQGIYVLVSNYIGAGEGIIRCAVFADHSEADLDALADSLSRM
jgi:8-amino-7-oxononanoate synthase